ncbi:glycosyltransferase family 4 protein [Microcoleus sp. B3-A4]|uniref:glycosyltransferase family 4 protein n=1 Tax=Microcoleus sp. B3-A4 TaxID=2818653 RepID=UPI002FD0312B
MPLPQPTLIQQLRSLLRGRGWLSAPKTQKSHFDKVDVESRVIETNRPIIDLDVPDADIVMATWWETTEWVAKLSPSKGTKVYLLQHYEAFDYVPQGRVEATRRLPMHKIAVALWPADIARNQYGDLSVFLVPPTADTKQFYDPLSRAPQPRGKQLVPTVGSYYTTTPGKGCDIALKAFSIAAEKIPNLRLVAFGSGNTPHPNLLPDGLEYNKAPTQDQVKEFYSKCDAWLFSSRSEGFGLPIIEAMASACQLSALRLVLLRNYKLASVAYLSSQKTQKIWQKRSSRFVSCLMPNGGNVQDCLVKGYKLYLRGCN